MNIIKVNLLFYSKMAVVWSKNKKGSMQPEQEAFMGRLIIDDTTIYEMDEECLRQKERKEKDLKSANVESWESKASHTDKGKERPAP